MIKSDEDAKDAIPVYWARLVQSDEEEDGPQEVHNDESDDGFGGYRQLFQGIDDTI